MEGKARFNKTETILLRVITCILIALSVSLTFTRFSVVFERTKQAFEDCGRTLAYHVLGWANQHGKIKTTVQEMPSNMSALLPLSWAEFKAGMTVFGHLLINKYNLAAYFAWIGGVFYNVGAVLLPCLILLGFFVGVMWLLFRIPDNEKGCDSAPLRAWKFLEDLIWCPIKNFVWDYLSYLVIEGRKFAVVLCIVWAVNLNVITVALETLAWILWVCWSHGFSNIFLQIAKLLADVSVLFQTLPVWLLFLIGYGIFTLWRRAVGFSKLKDDEASNERFLRRYPGMLLLTGPPRAGKTKGITDMALTQEVVFRKICEKQAQKRHMQFEHFNWECVRNSIKEMRKRVRNFNLEFIRELFPFLKLCFQYRAILHPTVYKNILTKLHNIGYQADDFIFGYDYKKYGMEYDDGLTIIDVFECAELYAENFSIYSAPTPLIFGNYPIRTQIQWKDFGHYPIMKADFFKLSTRKRKEISQFCHIVNHDASRLGLKKDPNGIYNDAYDRGVRVLSEIGKELGNQITNREYNKEKGKAPTSNPNTDLWTVDAKMISHGTYVDGTAITRTFGDEQRSMSVQADFRELGYECKVSRKEDKEYIKLPFFALDTAVYLVADKIMEKAYTFFESRHGLNTLTYYLIKKIYKVIFNHYHRNRNIFGGYNLECDMKDWAGDDEEKGKRRKRRVENYKISYVKVHSGTYNTAFWSTPYRQKFKRSKVGGLDNTPQFTGLDVTINQMEFMKSHFNEKVFKLYGMEMESPYEWKRAAINEQISGFLENAI